MTVYLLFQALHSVEKIAKSNQTKPRVNSPHISSVYLHIILSIKRKINLAIIFQIDGTKFLTFQ